MTLQIMWTAKWASQSVHKIDKNFAPNCILYLNSQKTQFLAPKVKENLVPLKGSTFRLNFNHGMVMGAFQF